MGGGIAYQRNRRQARGMAGSGTGRIGSKLAVGEIRWITCNKVKNTVDTVKITFGN